MKLKLSIFVIFLFIISCTQSANQDACVQGKIKIAGECCFDSNSNSICDDLEPKSNEAKPKSEMTKVTGEVSKPLRQQYISLKELEDGINKSYFPIKRYKFKDEENRNATGIENTFDLRISTLTYEIVRFGILKIKKDYNFLTREENFTNFVQRRYDLKVKNNDIDAKSYIDYKQIDNDDWNEADYLYDHKLGGINVAGKKVFLEKHFILWYVDNGLKDISIEYKINLWCTPELVVEVHETETFDFLLTYGDAFKENHVYINGLLEQQKKPMMKDAEKILNVCSGNAQALKLKPEEVVFYGKDGFYPSEVKMKAGNKLIIHNENDYTKAEFFTFIGDKTGAFLSPLVNYTTSEEVQIKQPDTYTLLVPEYAGRVKIIAE
ncbi:hypothetical protein HY637_01110 [Candidatus Woesearchaeota archaeon]|nr:hypothetical protein [Candidatus Pacearchaeota archaeon]MBI4452003.1 hypothetical protein [Candidatus Woesearchaeota archaeon]